MKKKKNSPPVPHLLQAQQTPALPYATVVGRPALEATQQLSTPQPPKFEPPHDKTNKMTFAPSEDSDEPGHPPSLNRVFALRMKKH